MAVLINGTIMMFVGVGLVMWASAFPARRKTRRQAWERYGGYLFFAGIAMWGVAFAA